MWQDTKMLNASANVLFGLFALALFTSGLWWLTQRPMFALKTILVSAETGKLHHVNRLTIRATAIPRIQGNFFTANLDTVRAAFESVPWVRKATVRREWPNSLIIAIEEHEPLGTWGDNGRLLSVKGDVFTANLAEAEDDHDLVELMGPEGSEKEVLARYVELRAWFAQINLVPEAVQLSGRYAWSVKLSNGMALELGREQNDATLKERVDRLIGIYPQLVDKLQDRIESVDMRYPNGLALKAHGQIIGLDGKRK